MTPRTTAPKGTRKGKGKGDAAPAEPKRAKAKRAPAQPMRKTRGGEPAARLVVKRSRPGMGLGLFATDYFKKGEMIIEYTGKIIPTRKADTLGTKYLFEIDEDWTIDGSPKSNIARYVNHGCNPATNVEAEVDGRHIFYYAARAIEPGEELLVDYGEEYFDEFIKPHGCKCPAHDRA
ncbi:MAG TPA: SET domain-containing protein [Candidatus Paceibacterota bacterium]|nr:SET domain-containing protein [Candidatus Paceibacterota bacterium]